MSSISVSIYYPGGYNPNISLKLYQWPLVNEYRFEVYGKSSIPFIAIFIPEFCNNLL